MVSCSVVCGRSIKITRHVHLSERICSARCPYPTVGDRRASANAAKVGLGLAVLSQVKSTAVKRLSLLSLSPLIESRVPGSIPSSSPTSYHLDLASHVARRTLRRSLLPSAPVTKEIHSIWSSSYNATYMYTQIRIFLYIHIRQGSYMHIWAMHMPLYFHNHSKGF